MFEGEPETCWVNLFHGALYPHPDGIGIGIILHNSSRCAFEIWKIGTETENHRTVMPGTSCMITNGTRHLNLGRGFDFQINVLRLSKHWNELHHTLMESVEISALYQHQLISAAQSKSKKPPKKIKRQHLTNLG